MGTDSLPPLTDTEKECLVAPFYVDDDDPVKDKLNELIAKHNKFVILYAQHFHGHTDSYNTSFETTTPRER